MVPLFYSQKHKHLYKINLRVQSHLGRWNGVRQLVDLISVRANLQSSLSSPASHVCFRGSLMLLISEVLSFISPYFFFLCCSLLSSCRAWVSDFLSSKPVTTYLSAFDILTETVSLSKPIFFLDTQLDCISEPSLLPSDWVLVIKYKGGDKYHVQVWLLVASHICIHI